MIQVSDGYVNSNKLNSGFIATGYLDGETKKSQSSNKGWQGMNSYLCVQTVKILLNPVKPSGSR